LITIQASAMSEEVIKDRITHKYLNKFHGGDSEFLPLLNMLHILFFH
jgi:hypothetical protein